MNTFTQLPEAGSEVSLFIYTHVREDQIALFGFHLAEEKALFEKLLSVSGIGPKLAVNILGGMNTRELAATIRGGDAAKLTRMPGVGKKTAERMVLELKDKLAEFGVAPAAPRPRHPLEEDVLSALINLGYQPAAARKALEKLGPANGPASNNSSATRSRSWRIERPARTEQARRTSRITRCRRGGSRPSAQWKIPFRFSRPCSGSGSGCAAVLLHNLLAHPQTQPGAGILLSW